jgi:DNA polymerase (family X)
MASMPTPRAVSRSADPVISNAELARVFREIGDMLEILGEVVYKAVAYRRVADAVERWPEDVAALYRRGTPPKIPGAGDALSAKLRELAETGQLAYHQRLRVQVPDGLLDLLRIPGLGPRTVKLLHGELGIDSLESLRAAAEAGVLRSLKGLSARTEQNILAGIARLATQGSRLLLHDADALATELVAQLREVHGLRQITPAGSLRRRCATIGDLDLLAATDDPAALVAAFSRLPSVERILSAGTDKSSVVLASGRQVDLMVCAPIAWGTHLVHFTGSRDHNVALRGRALERGLSLSEKGFKVVDSGELELAATEEEVYARLGLPWISPELREDHGEIEAARQGKLPHLVTLADIRGDLHVHTTESDGHASLAEMAQAAQQQGYAYIAITDHSKRVTVARGLDAKRLARQIDEIARLNETQSGFAVLSSVEVDILEDGKLDLPDSILRRLDFAVGAVHSAFDLPRDKQTERLLKAMDNPHIAVIAHPTGRLIDQRGGVDLDIERVLTGARERGCALEVNGQPDRLDLNEWHCKLAKDIGVKLVTSTDAHSTVELGFMRFAVDQARRGWLEPADVVNSRDLAGLRQLLRRG